jgi:hypothetical protein
MRKIIDQIATIRAEIASWIATPSYSNTPTSVDIKAAIKVKNLKISFFFLIKRNVEPIRVKTIDIKNATEKK